MRILIVTDAPTMLLKSSTGQFELAGSYRSVTSARTTLECRGHEVHILIIMNDLTVFSEPSLLKSLDSHPGSLLENLKGGLKLNDALKRSAFDATLVSLSTGRLRILLPSLLGFLKEQGKEPVIFIGAGKRTRQHVLQLSDSLNVPVSVYEKPGVARITSKGLDQFMAVLDK